MHLISDDIQEEFDRTQMDRLHAHDKKPLIVKFLNIIFDSIVKLLKITLTASLAIGFAALALLIIFILPIFVLQKFLIIPIDNLISPIMSSLEHGPFLDFFQGLGPTPFTFLMIVSTLIIIGKLLRFNQNRLFVLSSYLCLSTYYYLILSAFSLGTINTLIGIAITQFIHLKIRPDHVLFQPRLKSLCISYLVTVGLVSTMPFLVKAQLVGPFLLMLILIPVASIVARLLTMMICKIAPTSKFSKTVKIPFAHEGLMVGSASLSYYAMAPHAYGFMGITAVHLNFMLLGLTGAISGLINSYLFAKIFSHHDYISCAFLIVKQCHQLVYNKENQDALAQLKQKLNEDYETTLRRFLIAVEADPEQFNLLVFIQSLDDDQPNPTQSVHNAGPVEDTNTELGKLAEEYAGPSLTLQPEDQKNFDRIKSIIRKQERPIRSIYMMAISTIAAVSVYLINPNLMMPNLSPLNLSSITVYQVLLALTGLFVVSTLALGSMTTSKSENIFNEMSQTSVTNVNLVLPRKAVNNATAIELSSQQRTHQPQASGLRSDTAESRDGHVQRSMLP